MKPRSWLLLGLLCACGLFAATASWADGRIPSPPKSSANLARPVAERVLLNRQDSAPSVFAEYDSDCSDLDPELLCSCSTLDWCAAYHSLTSGESSARGGAPSLLSQGVRLQV